MRENTEWCQECANNYSFQCCGCDHYYHTDQRHSVDGDEYCEHCFEDSFNYCNNCENPVSRDDSQYVDDEPYCECCYQDHYFYCRLCEQDLDREEHVPIDIEGGKVCEQCFNEHGSEFSRCPHTNHNIWIRDYNMYVLENGSPVSLNWARSNLPGSLCEAMQREMRNSRNAIESQLNVRDSLSGRFIPRMPKRSIGDFCSIIINKVKSDLSSRNAPGVSPVHDRIYIGMEIEAQGGKYFTYTNTRGMQGRGITMGPHKMLNRELPNGTRMVRDGSIRGNNGQEFLPPIVKKQADWKKIERTMKALKTMDWKSNDSCGLHFHFSHATISPENPKLVKEIFRIFYHLEPFIFQCLPLPRRNNEFCKPIKSYFTPQEIKQDIKLDYWYYGNFWKKRIRRPNDPNHHPSFVQTDRTGRIVDHINFGDGKMGKENMKIAKEQDHYFIGRYIGCNLHALYTKGTIELRYFPSILEFSYVYAWAKIMEKVFEYAIKGGTHEPIEKIMNDGMPIEDKSKALGKVFGWKDAITHFLNGEIKTYSKVREGQMDMLTGEMRDRTNPERLNLRLTHQEKAIVSAEPIPELHPEAEKQSKTKKQKRIEAARIAARQVRSRIHEGDIIWQTSQYDTQAIFPPLGLGFDGRNTVPEGTIISQETLDQNIEEALAMDLAEADIDESDAEDWTAPSSEDEESDEEEDSSA